MFSSTIIPTINRQTLSRAVLSVLDQDFTQADFEVIVVNDSGRPLADADWQKSPRVHVVNTNHRERCAARNAGAAIAIGQYLHFLDDDDVLLPGSLQAFWEVSQREPQADWLYGWWMSVDNNGNQVEIFTPELSGNIFHLLVCGESLPLQSSLVKADSFFSVGAFDTDPLIIGVEDRDMGRRLALYSDVAHVKAIVAQVRAGEVGSTTNWKAIASGDQWGREKALQKSQTFERLRKSPMDSFWRGRVSRAYFASGVWNLKRRHLLMALSRFVMGVAITGFYFFHLPYWVGLRTKVK
jgi:glycosyltransferase involved in cell wall biosynthesis